MRVVRNLMSIESEWNPKVLGVRALTHILPEPALFFIKKHYHAYLFTHMPDKWIEEGEEEAAALPSFISPGDSVVDIGANVGFYSRFLAGLVGQKGHVYAFEPIPLTFESLCHNLEKLKLFQVEPLAFALSDSDRIDIMEVPNYRWGQPDWYGARFKGATPDKPKFNRREIEVHCRTLDSFSLPKISFIKCDAEYHELAVLRSGLETIRKYHPVILVEIFPDPDDINTTAYRTFALLASEGYKPYCFREGKMLLRQPGERSHFPPNYFFLTDEHVERYFGTRAVAVGKPAPADW